MRQQNQCFADKITALCYDRHFVSIFDRFVRIFRGKYDVEIYEARTSEKILLFVL